MPKPFMPGSGAYVESPSSLGDVILRVEHTEGDRKVYDLAFDDSVLRRPDFVEQIKKEISKVRPGVTWMSLSLILNGVTLDNAMSYDDVKQVSSCDPLMWVIEMSMVAIKAPGSIFCQRPKERKTYIKDIYKILDDFKSKILTVSSETSSHAVCLAEQLHQQLRT